MTKYKAILLAALVMLGALLTPLASPLLAQGKSVFGWIVADRATIQAGGLSVVGDTALGDDLTLTDDATLSGDLILTAQTVITVTNGATLSPAGAVQRLASAGAVGFGAITVGSAGSVLVLINTVNQTITITDTGTLKLAGNAALGQYDAIQLVSDGTNWIEVGRANN